jgi:hypothetical protein
MKRLSLTTLFLLCFSLLAARQVRADSIDYTYVFGSNTFTWVLPVNPVISPSNAIAGESITIPDVSFMENGASMVGTLDFLNSAPGFDGGFDIMVSGCCLVNNTGPQLYSGPESTPTMLTGTGITLTELGSDGVTPIGTGTLTATLVTSSVAEPSTILLVVIGLASGLALTLFRKN